MNSEKRNISVYMALNGQNINNGLPPIRTPANNIKYPNESDYQNGFYNRYFVKKINNDFAYETSDIDYSEVDTTIWQKAELNWKITGTRYTENSSQGIEPYNNLQISVASLIIPEIKNLLTNPVQFAHFS